MDVFFVLALFGPVCLVLFLRSGGSGTEESTESSRMWCEGVSHRHDLERSALIPDAAESRIVLI